ncbi:hypothetical protein QQZ08_000481 [Neonectria magnoliae]|uniref:Glycan binding protein Y3-like domain-containing protein n=1 Tax=Neonectria magnoliae TaxID=2732573 RepID=A0ABR1IJ74_9HYPO
MKASLFLASLAAVLASASPTLHKRVGCYGGGNTWGDRSNAEIQASRACDELDGDYAIGQRREACFGMFTGQHVVFEIYRAANSFGQMSRDYCISSMTAVINECERGGIGSSGDWEFKADPNEGGGNCPL